MPATIEENIRGTIPHFQETYKNRIAKKFQYTNIDRVLSLQPKLTLDKCSCNNTKNKSY